MDKEVTTERVSRRSVLKYTSGGGLAMLAGCSGNPSSTSTPTTDTGSTAQTETAFPADYLEGETIKIGVLAPRPFEHPWGRSIAKSAELAAKEIRSGPGILGAEIELLFGDTRLSAGQARDEHRRLTFQEGCDVTIGPMLSPMLIGVMESVAQQETLNLSVGATSVEPSKKIRDQYEKYKYQFRPGPININQFAQNTLTFLDNYGTELWDSAAVLTENYYSLRIFQDLLEGKVQNHLDVTLFEEIAAGTGNWGPIFDRVERSGADVCLIFQTLSGTAAVKQWGDEKRPFEFGGLNVQAMLNSFYDELDGAARYFFSINQVTPQAAITPLTQPYLQSYFDEVGSYPIYTGPITFDAVNLFAQAVRETGTTNSDELVAHLEEMRFENTASIPYIEFLGPDAKFPHDAKWTGMEDMGVPLWFQWQEEEGEGVMEVFAPEKVKTAEYKRPHWI